MHSRQGSKRKRQKTGLNRNLLDVGIGNLTSLIKYKLEEAVGIFSYVHLSIAPSQTCPNCGKKRKKELSERVHTCDCEIDPISILSIIAHGNLTYDYCSRAKKLFI
jgi:putative transposase